MEFKHFFHTPHVIKLQFKMRHGCIYEKAVEERERAARNRSGKDWRTASPGAFPAGSRSFGAKEVARQVCWTLSELLNEDKVRKSGLKTI